MKPTDYWIRQGEYDGDRGSGNGTPFYSAVDTEPFETGIHVRVVGSNQNQEVEQLKTIRNALNDENDELKEEIQALQESYGRLDGVGTSLVVEIEGLRRQVLDYQAQLADKHQDYLEALEDIANHKQDSVDKVYLMHQCEGYQERARRALAPAAERQSKRLFSIEEISDAYEQTPGIMPPDFKELKERSSLLHRTKAGIKLTTNAKGATNDRLSRDRGALVTLKPLKVLSDRAEIVAMIQGRVAALDEQIGFLGKLASENTTDEARETYGRSAARLRSARSELRTVLARIDGEYTDLERFAARTDLADVRAYLEKGKRT